MAREYFVCPNCEAEISDPSSATFCDGCGVNLSRFDKLEKKTVYGDWEYCPDCSKPCISSERRSWDKGDWHYSQYWYKCRNCGHEHSSPDISKYYHDSSFEHLGT